MIIPARSAGPLVTSCLAVSFLLAGCGGAAPDDPGADAHAEAMRREHAGERPVASPGITAEPEMEVQGREVRYAEAAGETVTGYLALPVERQGDLPGLVVIHEWWGLNDNIRAMTRRLAGQGYAALAVDLYGGEVAEDADRAHALMQASRERESAIDENLSQAVRFLRERYDADRVGTIGWCFGGGWSLNAALAMPERIDATVVYYGRVETDPARLAPLQAPLLGLFGGEDRGIPVETVREFQRALDGLGKQAEIRVYPDAGHAFANPSGERWNVEAAEDAWRLTLEFLARHLQPPASEGG